MIRTTLLDRMRIYRNDRARANKCADFTRGFSLKQKNTRRSSRNFFGHVGHRQQRCAGFETRNPTFDSSRARDATGFRTVQIQETGGFAGCAACYGKLLCLEPV